MRVVSHLASPGIWQLLSRMGGSSLFQDESQRHFPKRINPVWSKRQFPAPDNNTDARQTLVSLNTSPGCCQCELMGKSECRLLLEPLRLKWWIHVLLLEQNLTLISRICVLWGGSLSWKAPNPSLSEIHVTPLPFWCFPINCLWISWPGELDVLQAWLGKPCSVGRSIFADDSRLHVLQTGCIWI